MTRKVLEVRSKTVEEAINEGLGHLQVSREDVSVKIVEEPARSLGFSSEAVIWLVYEASEESSEPEIAFGTDDEDLDIIPVPEDSAEESLEKATNDENASADNAETSDELIDSVDELEEKGIAEGENPVDSETVDEVREDIEAEEILEGDSQEEDSSAESVSTDAPEPVDEDKPATVAGEIEENVDSTGQDKPEEETLPVDSQEETDASESEDDFPDGPLALSITERGICLRVDRSEYSGTGVKERIRAFLDESNIFGVPEDVLTQIADTSTEKFTILTPEIVEVNTSMISILRREDLTAASMIVYDRSDASLDSIKSALNENGIIKGIDEDAIRALLADDPAKKCAVIARSIESIPRKYGELEFQVSSEEVDWPGGGGEEVSELRTLRIGAVDEGQVILKRELQSEGVDGYTIDGAITRCTVVEATQLRAGANIDISDDGSNAKALKSGHFIYSDHVLRVEENVKVIDVVNSDSGQIKHDGMVFVRGNVETKGMIRADGDVIIAGVLNNGTVVSGGDVVIGKGISNDEGGSVQLEGNLRTKSIVSSSIEARAVRVDNEIVESNVTAIEAVEVLGNPGMIVGGKIAAGSLIEANVFGDQSGTLTQLGVRTSEISNADSTRGPKLIARRALHKGVDITIDKATDKVTEDKSGTTITVLDGKLHFSELR